MTRCRSVTDDSQEPLMCRWNAYFGQPVLIDVLQTAAAAAR